MRPADARVRVLSVIHPFRPEFSGEGEWWLRMIPYLRERGVDVEILANGLVACITGVVEGITVHRAPIAGGRRSLARHVGRLLGVALALRRRRRQFDIALFHSPANDTVYASCLAGRLWGWKTVYKATLLDADDFGTIATSGRLGRVRLLALRLAHGYISLSRTLVRSYENQPWLSHRLLVAPQGVDLGRFRPADAVHKSAARRELALPSAAPVVLFCGALIERKGVDLLVEAWREVAGQLPEAVLLMVGPNHENGLTEPEHRRFSEATVRRIEELGLAQRVRVAGYQRLVERYYAAADAFVFPSRLEGWGSAITEAMACGLPSVVSPLRGIAEEHLEDGVEGFIARSQAPHEYAQRLVWLLQNNAAARRIGACARRRVEARLAAGPIADRYAAFFRGIVRGQPIHVRTARAT